MKSEKYPDFYDETRPTQHKNIKLGKKNRKLIQDYFHKNPNARRDKCAKDLGFCKATVDRHLRILNAY